MIFHDRSWKIAWRGIKFRPRLVKSRKLSRVGDVVVVVSETRNWRGEWRDLTAFFRFVGTGHESRNVVAGINARVRSVSRNQRKEIPFANRDRYYPGACIASRRQTRLLDPFPLLSHYASLPRTRQLYRSLSIVLFLTHLETYIYLNLYLI